MCRAPVPEASVNEHRDARRAEDEISAPADVRQRATINGEAQPQTMDLSTDDSLRAGVTARLPLHANAD